MTADEPRVTIRELADPDDLSRLVGVFDEVWHPDPTNRPVSADLLRALAHGGNYVVGIYLDEMLVGGSVGFFATPIGQVLHSHMTGVSAAGDGLRLGLALKQHQRAWCRDRGLTTITWTFDPLVARNAYFNLTKLGAVPTEYHRHFYGHTGDELAGDDESDRLVMAWRIDADDVSPRPPTGLDPIPAVDSSDPDRPRVLISDPSPTDAIKVPLPTDIAAVRRDSPTVAYRWRHAVREVLEPLIGGGRPVWFTRAGSYVFGPEEAP